MYKKEVQYETITIREYIKNSFLEPIASDVVRQIEEVDQYIIGETRDKNRNPSDLWTKLTLDTKMTVGKCGFPIKEYDYLTLFGLKNRAICVVFCNNNRWNSYEFYEWEETLKKYADYIVRDIEPFSELYLLRLWDNSVTSFLDRVLTDLACRDINGTDHCDCNKSELMGSPIWQETFTRFCEIMAVTEVDDFMIKQLEDQIKLIS